MSKSILPGGRITNRAGRERPRFIRPVERQRMRPWLEEHLDKNDIPGLTWVEKDERIFRIAWKHAANQCFNLQKDTNLFERWAIHTGRHYDSDHKRWKANFRCALNSLPDVKENKEQGIKKGNNAFKVYRFLDEKETRGAKETKVKKRSAFGSDDTIKSNDDDNEDYGSTEQILVDDEERDSPNLPSMPKLDQLYPSTGVEMLIEAGFKGAKEKVEPLTDTSEDTNLQEILAAATASLAAGSDPATLENISINQLKRLGDVSLMRLDVRQSVKKSTSGFMYVFLCRWCEKVFPRKIELFQHFLVMHQDKLLAGEDYGDQAGHDKSDPKHKKLLEEIQDLEQKVLGFSEKSYQSSEAGSDEAIEDQMVPSDKMETGTESEDKALDLTMKAKTSKLLPKQETALDLSLSTDKKLKLTKHLHGKLLGKRRRSSQETELTYSMKFGNYGIAGTPRTKRQMSLHSRKKEEEQERIAKKIMTTEGSDPSRQHSMEDIVHAEMLLSLKTGNDEGSEKGSGKSTSKKDNNGKGKKGKHYAKRSLKMSKTLDRERIADNRESDEEYEKWMKSTEKDDSELPKTVKAYKCGLCFQRFTSPGTLFLHVESHAGTFVHVCNQCGKKCESHQDLLEHVGSSHPSVTHRCNFCWKLCRTVKKLKNHMWLHISVCKKCGERFYNPELLDIHLLDVHGIKPKKQKQLKSKQDTLIKSEEMLDDHIDEEEEDEEEDEEDEEEMGLDNESNATTEIAEDSDNDPDNNTTDILKEADITDNMDHSHDIKQEPDSESDKDIRDSKESVDGIDKDNIKEKEEVNIEADNENHSGVDDNMGTVESSSSIPNLEELTKETFEGEQQLVDGKDTSFKNINADPVPNTDVKMEIKSEDNETFISTSKGAELTDTAITKKDDEEPNKNEVSGISDVADRIKAAEKMLNLINGTSQSTETGEVAADADLNIIKGHDVEIFKVRANQLISIMNTAEIGNCLICNKAVTMNLMISHIKTHSIVELSRAKGALDLMNIKIHALERPLFLCNLCNLGFDSCETLASHVNKHLTPSGKQKGAGGKKRKIDTDFESSKMKVMKTSKVKSKTTIAEKKATQATSVSSASAGKQKVFEVCGKKELVSSGSILAAYLNAGPKYQASSLTKFIKQSQDVADKTNVNSTGAKQAFSGLAVTKTATYESMTGQTKSLTVQTKSIAAFSKDKTDIESAIAKTQCIAIPSQSGTVLLSVNNKCENTTKEGSRPIPLMFLKDEKSPDLKIVPASSLMQLTQELKSSQLIKVIPPSLLPNQLGKIKQSSTSLDQTNMFTTNLSTALSSASSMTSASLSVTSSLNRSIVVARPSGDGNSLSEGAGPKSVFVVPNTVLRHINELGETATEKNESKKVNDTSDSTNEDFTYFSVDNVGDSASDVQPTMAKPIPSSPTISGSLPASILHGQNLPLSLQNSQVRLISPGNVSKSGGQQQITILKWPMTVQMGRIASPAQGVKSKTELFPGEVSITQASSSINAQTSIGTTSSGLKTNTTANAGMSPALSKTNSLHLESLLKKPPLSGQSSGISSTSAASSVVKPPSSLMNVMLSQYLRSQGVLTSSVANLKATATPTPKPVLSEPTTVTSLGQKPTFNLVITQTPPTQPTVTSNPSIAGNTGLFNRLGIVTKQENKSETGSGSPKTSPAPVTQRLALICSLCMTELQNLEMISQHVCPAVSPSFNPHTNKCVIGDGGRPTGGVVFPCIVCNQDFYDLDISLAHQRGHNLRDSDRCRQCQLCAKCFMNDVTYGNHLKTCHSKRIIACPLCTQTFPDQKACVEHLEKDHSAETKCNLCEENSRLFLNASDLTLHMIFAHPFECPSCDFRCVKERELWSHILNHPKTHKQSDLKTNQGVSQSHEQGVICKKCLVGFVSLQTFQIHVRLLHPGESFESLMEINPEKCHLCDFSFKHKKTLHQHLETFHMRKLVYFCSVCNQNCATPSLLVRHLKEHLKQSMLEIEFCHLCRKVFPRKSLHTQHMRVTHGMVEVSLNRSSKSLFSNVSTDFKSLGQGNNSVGDQTLMFQTAEETVSTCDLETQEKSALSDSTKMEVVDEYKTLSEAINLKLVGSHNKLSDTTETGIADDQKTLNDTRETDANNDLKTLSDTTEMNFVESGKTPPNMRLKCETCGVEGFKSRFLLKQHRVIRHIHPHARTSSSYYQHVIENIKRPKSFDCVVCGTRFDNKNAFKMHKNCRKVDRRKLYGCALCNKTFHKLMKLTKHMWNHDQSAASTSTGEGNDSKRGSMDIINRFKCNVCSECFHDSASLFQHAKCHLDRSKLEAMARNKLKHALSVTGDPTKIPSN